MILTSSRPSGRSRPRVGATGRTVDVTAFSLTCSRTLAGNYPVSTETRARVMVAVESLHYVVNVHAKALSGRVAGPVALVIKDITGPSLAHVAAGVEQAAADRGG